MPRQSFEESKDRWANNIVKQRQSGLTIERWCKKNNIAKQTFYSWQKKLFSKNVIDRSAFTEIPHQSNPAPIKTGISLEYEGIHIRLDPHFDPLTLKQCLKVLKDVAC